MNKENKFNIDEWFKKESQSFFRTKGIYPFLPKEYFLYKKTKVSQHPDIFNKLWLFLTTLEFIPGYIIETGTSYGGLTWIISDMCDSLKWNTKIITIDPFKTERNNKEIDYMIENCKHRVEYWEKNAWDEEVIKKIKNLTNDKLTLFFLDGGDKPKDFNIYKNIAKKNDRLLVHDFAKNKEYFTKNIFEKNIWMWNDAVEEDLSLDYIIRDNMFNELESVCWGTYIKNE